MTERQRERAYDVAQTGQGELVASKKMRVVTPPGARRKFLKLRREKAK